MAFFVAKGSEAAAEDVKGSDLLAAAALTEALAGEGGLGGGPDDVVAGLGAKGCPKTASKSTLVVFEPPLLVPNAAELSPQALDVVLAFLLLTAAAGGAKGSSSKPLAAGDLLVFTVLL